MTFQASSPNHMTLRASPLDHMTLKYGDCFSGISCPAMALRKLNIPFKYMFACEIDKNPRAVLENNFDIEEIYKDIKTISSLPKVDLFVSGFPCQPYSTVNIQIKTENHKSYGLFYEAVRCLKLCDTEMFILENVASLCNKSHVKYYDEIIAELETLDNYNFKVQRYNSKDYGTPQSRNRVWFIGWKKHLSCPNGLVQQPLKFKPFDIFNTSLQYNRNLYETHIAILNKTKYNGDYVLSNGGDGGSFCRFIDKDRPYIDCIITKPLKFVRLDNIPHCRHLEICEIVPFFGLDYSDYNWINLSYGRIIKCLGNGMDVNLVGQIIKSLLQVFKAYESL